MSTVRTIAVVSIVVIIASLLLPTPIAAAATLQVPGNYATIQSAIDAAQTGDTVVVSPGVYVENLDFRGKDITVISASGPETTIIDGNQSGPVVVFTNGETRAAVLEGFTITNGSGFNAGLEILGGGIYCVGASPTIAGNLIAFNMTTLPAMPLSHGCGIYCGDASEALIRDNRIEDNGQIAAALQGAGIFIRWSSPVEVIGNELRRNGGFTGVIACAESSAPIIRDNLIEDNTASGVSSRSGSAPTVENNTILRCYEGIDVIGASALVVGNHIEECSGVNSGGVTCITCDLYLQGNTILRNEGLVGGAMYFDGSKAVIEENHIESNSSTLGGLYAVRTTLTIQRNDFIGNHSRNWGGAIFLQQETLSPTPSASIIGNRFIANRAQTGGAIETLWAKPTLLANEFVDNFALEAGGAIHAQYGNRGIPIQSCVFRGNEVRDAGGGGGAIYANGVRPACINCTFTRNSADEGGAIHSRYDRAEIANCILWQNSAKDGEQIYDPLSRTTVHHSVVNGGWEGNSNLDVDPRFVDLDAGDLHLRHDSPGIDAGVFVEGLPDTDDEGDARAVDGDGDGMALPDIGADELRPEIAARFGTVNQTGDFAANVLLVNGSAGGRRRTMMLSKDDPLEVSMLAAPAGPTPARFVLYAWREAPDLDTLAPQPFGLGSMVLSTPLASNGSNLPSIIWNNLGHAPRLGVPQRPSTPAPSTPLSLPAGIGFPATVTLQGFLEDTASAANGPVSITNAVILRAE